MKKLNNLQKSDLEFIGCIEFIDDYQAETLSAGSFRVTSRNGDFNRTISAAPGSATSYSIDSSTPSLGLRNTGSGNEGDVFRVSFANDDEGLLSRRLVRSGGRIRKREILDQVRAGAEFVSIEQLSDFQLRIERLRRRAVS